MKPRTRCLGGLVVIATLVGAVGVAPTSGAELSDLVLTIAAQTEGARQGSGEILIYQEDGWWQGDTFYWQAEQDLEITDPDTGEVLGIFMQSAIISYVVPPEGARSNPQVNLGFAMQAGEEVTTFTVSSALLSFGPYVDPDARASVGFSVSDSGMDGAELAGAGPTGGAYLAQYNGFVPGGTTFNEAIQSMIVTEPFGTVTADSDTGWLPVAGSVSDMSSQVNFTLTPGDFASGTSTFQMVPEPSAVLLLVAGLAIVRRR